MSRLLAQAIDRGILVEHLTAVPPPSLLETRLRERFPVLQDIVVVPADTHDPLPAPRQRQNVGHAAARYFTDQVPATEGTTIAVAGGQTTYEMVRHLPQRSREQTLVPAALIGRPGPDLLHFDPLAVLIGLWSQCGGPSSKSKAYYAPVPPYSARTLKEARQERLAHLDLDAVKTLLKKIAQAEYVFTSVGPARLDPRNNSAHSTLRLLARIGVTQDTLAKCDAAGDIMYSYFTTDGSPLRCEGSTEDFFITLGFRGAQRLVKADRRVVVLAALEEQVAPLAAALRGKCFNVLITTSIVAQQLVGKP